jgi:hypothetical protein
MGQRLVANRGGHFTLEVVVQGPVLDDALQRADADEVLTSAMIAALAVLAQEGPWPDALLRTMGRFMEEMRSALRQETLM